MYSLLLTMVFFAGPDLGGRVAAEMAYALLLPPSVVETECCGLCVRGVITHGDGHKTACPCSKECKCKSQN
mgnify:CR=1 FL=1